MARIAVIDDNPHIRELLKSTLATRKHEVIDFADGGEALLAIQSTPVDLVLADVEMPSLDGISLCKVIRETWDKSELPVVVISVLSEEDDILRAFDAGANDYLIKPFSPSVVLAKVGMFLKEDARPPSGKHLILEAPPEDLPCRFDKYDLIAQLGTGNYGVVYKARRRVDNRILALKIVRQHLNDDRELLARFFREIAVLASLDLPRMVKFLDSGFERGLYFIVTDLVRGVTAQARLRDTGAFPISLGLRLGRDICSVIVGLAERELAHRDIKPANIMIEPGGNGVLIDFGLARGGNQQDITQTGYLMGTPEYLAPEIIRGFTPGTIASDLYALGVSLFQLLCGLIPYPVQGQGFQAFKTILEGPAPPALNRVRRIVPPELSDLIASMIERDLKRRLVDPQRALDRFEALLEQYG